MRELLVYCLTLSVFITSSSGDLTCIFEQRRQGSLHCVRLGESPNDLETAASLGDVTEWNQIETIVLNSANVQSVARPAFSKAKALKHLDLSNNVLMDIADNTFADLTGLQSLNLADNYISVFDSEAFEGLKQLRFLDLSRNFLAIDELRILPIESLTNLRVLFLSNISDIDLNHLKVAPSLRTFVASESRVVLDDHSLEEATQLTTLNLSKTKQTSLPKGLLTNFPLLRILSFARNEIKSTDIPDNFFGTSTKLTILDLSHNAISSLSNEKLFSINTELKYLDLSHNSIDAIHVQLFANNKKLVDLNLSNNKLAKLPPQVFGVLVNLKHLDLSHNTLTTLPSFIRNKKLYTLLLGDNNLKTLSSSAFQGLSYLKALDLSGNKMEQFSVQLIRHMSESLTNLNLSRNRLSTLPSGLLTLDFLTFLSVSCNLLTSLPSTFFDTSVTNPKKIELHGNPWKCACLKDSLDEAKAHQVQYILARFTDGNHPTCIAGDSYKTCSNTPLSAGEISLWQESLALYPQMCK